MPPTINSDDVDNDICFIVRMILGLKYKEFRPEKQIKNCFIELLNGKNFDVDKLDYIIRDTKMSGISNISIDVDRLLNALTLVISTKYTEYVFTNYDLKNCFVKEFSFSDNDWCEMNGHFYGTVELSEGAEVCIIGGAENITLEPVSVQVSDSQIESKVVINEYVDLKEAQEAYVGDKAIQFDERRKVYPLTKGLEGRYVLRNIHICDDNNFEFIVTSNKYNLIISGDCCFKIKGKAKLASVKVNGKVSGKCKKMIILGEHLGKGNMVPKRDAHNVFSVGFKKQAINLLSNVLEARDYLYLWIYAHHKVIYYANFLVPCLAELIDQHADSDNFPNWELNYSDIDMIDDAYINTSLKYIYKKKNEKLSESQVALLYEYFSRNYKKSVYKSLAEYDLFFSEFDMKQKNEIKGYLDEICSQEDKENRGNLNYGIVPNEHIEKINSYSEEAKLKSLIWVSASYSHKILNKGETYCVFPNNEVVTMEYLNLFKSQDHFSNSNTNHYFYLYYEAEKGDDDKIKDVLIKYFKSI